jgi:rSAM/selenodomain-associated transferase 2
VKLSIVIPTLNEAEGIEAQLSSLASLRDRAAEIIVADGGSEDRTADLARAAGVQVIIAPRGRGSQMNAGAAAASGKVLLFLHADTRLPAGADRLIQTALADTRHAWGRFDVRIDGRRALLALVSRMMNLRSRLTGIATGDQAIFVTREIFLEVGGYPDIALMEDLVLSRALRRRSRPACLTAKVVTSARRWEANGPLRTIFAMWRLRFAFVLGTNPRRLALAYGYRPRDA